MDGLPFFMAGEQFRDQASAAAVAGRSTASGSGIDRHQVLTPVMPAAT